MNKIINKVFPIMTLALVLTLSACLNDSDYSNNWIGTKNNGNQNFVEVHLTSSDNTNTVSRSYDSFNRDTTINLIPVNLTSGPATSDVTVSFKVITDTIGYKTDSAKINLKRLIDKGFALPDLTKFVVQNTGSQVVIPAGSQTGYIKVKFNPFNFGGFYAFVIKLTAVAGDGGKWNLSNLTNGYVKFGIKNKYDGWYTATGTLVDAANAGITGAYPNDIYLETQSANSVAMFDVTINNFAHLIKSGASLSYYGSFAPVFTFDANNNVSSVVNYYGQPSGNGRSASLNTSAVSSFNPTTRSITVDYYMDQPSVIAGHRTHFVETYTYKGKRP